MLAFTLSGWHGKHCDNIQHSGATAHVRGNCVFSAATIQPSYTPAAARRSAQNLNRTRPFPSNWKPFAGNESHHATGTSSATAATTTASYFSSTSHMFSGDAARKRHLDAVSFATHQGASADALRKKYRRYGTNSSSHTSGEKNWIWRWQRSATIDQSQHHCCNSASSSSLRAFIRGDWQVIGSNCRSVLPSCHKLKLLLTSL